MARKLRLQYEGAIYHVTVRGNGRQAIFLEDSNRERLLWRLAESCELYEFLKDSPRAIGSREFRKWVDEEYAKLRDAQGSPEDVSFRREAVLKDADGIVRVVAEAFGADVDDMTRTMRGNVARPVAAQRAAGGRLGYNIGSAVSHQLRLLAERLKADAKLGKKVRRIERAIGKLE